jgi:glycosyltransferase involved in cell wall biosynthesis
MLGYHLSRKKGIELHIIMIGDENKEFKKNNITIHTIKKRKLFYIPFLTPMLLQNIKRKIIEINPDVVHGISTSYIYSPVVSFLRNKYPTVLTAYGIATIERKYYRAEYKRIRRFIADFVSIINERYVLSRIKNIVVDSSSIKNLVSKWTKSKIYVVPAGIEYDKIEKIQSHNLLDKSPDIFFVNALRKIKGVDILINTIPVIIKSIPSLSVYIAGTGPQENALKSLVKKLNLEDHVKFLGFVSEEEKYQYYKVCKLVVVPSRWDCQPAALFDAAASGKPVIASDMSNPGIVEDEKIGFIFKSENVKDLASKIIILLKNEKLREEMGKAAEAKVKQYGWSRVAERYVEIYKEVISDFHERKAKNKQKREKIL